MRILLIALSLAVALACIDYTQSDYDNGRLPTGDGNTFCGGSICVVDADCSSGNC